jgi:hypothetical protein
MEKFITGDDADPEITRLFGRPIDGRPSVVVAGDGDHPASDSESDTNCGFDNDPKTLNSIMYRMLGKPPARKFEARDLQFEGGQGRGER